MALKVRHVARNTSPRGVHWGPRLLAIMIGASFLVGCEEIGEPAIPDDVRTPSIVGVVEAIDQTTRSQTRFRLKGGREVDVDLGQAEMAPGGPPETGDLLMFGSTPEERPWLIRVRGDGYESDTGCFYTDWLGRAAGDASVDVVINGVPFGLRLPKAEPFASVDNRDGVYAVWRATFCLDADGRLLSYGW